MTAKRVLATASEGHLNGGTPNPREGILKVDLRGPHLRRRKVCIGPTRLPPLPTFSAPLPSSSVPLRLAKSPHLAGRCTCEAHACLPFSPFESRGPACRLDQKGSVLQLDEVLTSLSRTHLSFVRPVDRRGSPLLLSGHSSTTPDLIPSKTLLAAAISLARLVTFSHAVRFRCPRFCTVNKNEHKPVSGGFPY